MFAAMLAHFSANAVSFFTPVWREEGNADTAVIYIGLIWRISFILEAIEWVLKTYNKT